MQTFERRKRDNEKSRRSRQLSASYRVHSGFCREHTISECRPTAPAPPCHRRSGHAIACVAAAAGRMSRARKTCNAVASVKNAGTPKCASFFRCICCWCHARNAERRLDVYAIDRLLCASASDQFLQAAAAAAGAMSTPASTLHTTDCDGAYECYIRSADDDA
jgi:hypothetical protein